MTGRNSCYVFGVLELAAGATLTSLGGWVFALTGLGGWLQALLAFVGAGAMLPMGVMSLRDARDGCFGFCVCESCGLGVRYCECSQRKAARKKNVMAFPQGRFR